MPGFLRMTILTETVLAGHSSVVGAILLLAAMKLRLVSAFTLVLDAFSYEAGASITIFFETLPLLPM